MKDEHKKVQDELERLRNTELPAALSALEDANGQGDASQNPDTFFASEEISRINGRIAYLTEVLERHDDHPLPSGTIVVLDYGDGPEEHVMSPVPGERDGRTAITFRSLLGEALATAQAGDRIPSGHATVTVVAVLRPSSAEQDHHRQ